jgi:hypothetical protein
VADDVGGSGESVNDKVDAFFAENFPSDTWSDGEYRYTFDGVPVTMRYKYRTENTDPKDIPFVATAEVLSKLDTFTSVESFQINNLAEFYGAYHGLLEHRVAVNADMGSILRLNPVVPTYYEYEDLYSITTFQAGLKSYSGDGSYANVATVINFFVEWLDGTDNTNYAENCYFPQYVNWYYDYDYAYACFGDVHSSNSALPIPISTEAEMTALLETAEVGSVYKYTGTAGTYENGALYVVEAVTE